MKKLINSMFAVILFFSLFLGIWLAQNYDQRWDMWSSPIQILDQVVDDANDWWRYDNIQDTRLDWVNSIQWEYEAQYRISNTLDRIRNNIVDYLQWIVFIWLSLATVLIIYNGFMLVTHWVHGQWDISKFKQNMINISIWVLLLLWFYFVIEIILALVTTLFGDWTW